MPLTCTNAEERSLLARAPDAMARALGKPITVRSDKLPRGVKVSGTIVAVEPARFSYGGPRVVLRGGGFQAVQTVTLQYRVTVQAGLNKTNHVFILSRLPT